MLSRREQLGITKTSLAQTLGVTRAQLTKYENGINRISPARLEKLSELLDVGISWFFEFDTLPAPENDEDGRSVHRLVAAFRQIRSQDDRTTIIELAERFARGSGDR